MGQRGQGSKRVGAIDIGTNTFLCLIAEIESGKVVQVLADEVEIVRLGEGVHKNRKFAPQALERAEQCLRRFSDDLEMLDVETVAAVATSAARDVSNGQSLLDLGKKYDIPISIIDGTREAELTFAGVLTNPKFAKEIIGDIAVIDVGGGSTEVTYFDQSSGQGSLKGVSFDIGAVRMTEMFISSHPTSREEWQAMREYVAEKFKGFSKLSGKTLVGVAGTPTTVAALSLGIEYTRNIIEGHELTVTETEKWIQKLLPMSIEERAKLKGLEPKRADIIVAGATILIEAVKALGGDRLLVSTRGVRYGLAAELGSCK